MSEAEIVTYVTAEDKADEPSEEAEADAKDTTDESVETCTGSQAIQHIKALRDYCLQKSVDGLELLIDLEQLVTQKIVSDVQAKKQTKITAFMNKDTTASGI